MNTSDILNKAADLIEQHGWGIGSASMMGEGGLCIMGAIFAAEAGRLANEDESDDLAYDVVGACPAGKAMAGYLNWTRPATHLFSWNDDTGRTASEVIEVLRACAVIESSRERETAAVS